MLKLSVLGDINIKSSLFNISLCDDLCIKELSKGEVKKPIIYDVEILKNNNKFIPYQGGLACPSIFGSIAQSTCDCGQMGYSHNRVSNRANMSTEERILSSISGNNEFKLDRVNAHKNSTCNICKHRIIPIGKRLKNWGHINLTSPVVHIWFFNKPSNISALLDISFKNIQNIIYFNCYVITASTIPSLHIGKILSQMQYDYNIKKFGNEFKAQMGAEAIQDLLRKIDLKQLKNEIENKIKGSSTKHISRLYSRLKIVNDFIESNSRPENTILNTIPVLPMDLRLITLSENGVLFNTLNIAYQRVINRNNRLRRLIELNAPNIVITNEKRELQFSVDHLMDIENSLLESIPDHPIFSLSKQLRFLSDDNIFFNNLCFREKNSKNPVSQVKHALMAACIARDKGRDDLFFMMKCKLRGLCLNIKEINRINSHE